MVGRNELRRGLKALSAATRSNAGISEQHRGGGTAGSVQEDAWSEQDIDTLLYGLDLLSSGGAGDVVSDGSGDDSPIKRNTELTDVEFREKMMLAIAEGGTKVDRDLSARKSMLPLFERLQVRMETRHGQGRAHGNMPSSSCFCVAGCCLHAALWASRRRRSIVPRSTDKYRYTFVFLRSLVVVLLSPRLTSDVTTVVSRLSMIARLTIEAVTITRLISPKYRKW